MGDENEIDLPDVESRVLVDSFHPLRGHPGTCRNRPESARHHGGPVAGTRHFARCTVKADFHDLPKLDNPMITRSTDRGLILCNRPEESAHIIECSPSNRRFQCSKNILVPTDGSDLPRARSGEPFRLPRGRRQDPCFYAQPDFPMPIHGEGALIDPTTPEQFAASAKAEADRILPRPRRWPTRRRSNRAATRW